MLIFIFQIKSDGKQPFEILTRIVSETFIMHVLNL